MTSPGEVLLSMGITLIAFTGFLWWLSNPGNEVKIIGLQGCTATDQVEVRKEQRLAAPDDPLSVAPTDVVFQQYKCKSGKTIWLSNK